MNYIKPFLKHQKKWEKAHMDWVKERASRGYTYHLPRPIVTREGGGPDEYGWDIEDRWDEPPNLNGMTRCYEADIANVDIWRKMLVIRDSYQGESDQEKHYAAERNPQFVYNREIIWHNFAESRLVERPTDSLGQMELNEQGQLPPLKPYDLWEKDFERAMVTYSERADWYEGRPAEQLASINVTSHQPARHLSRIPTRQTGSKRHLPLPNVPSTIDEESEQYEATAAEIQLSEALREEARRSKRGMGTKT